jgi:hypothetical protein
VRIPTLVQPVEDEAVERKNPLRRPPILLQFLPRSLQNQWLR